MRVHRGQDIQDIDERIDDFERLLYDVSASQRPIDASSVRQLRSSLEDLRAAERTILGDNRALVHQLRRAADDSARYRALFEQAPDAWFITGATGIVREANRAAARLTERDARDIVGADIASFFVDDRRPQQRTLLGRARRDGRVDDEALTLRCPDGSTHDVAASLRRLPGDADATIAWHLREATASMMRDAEERGRDAEIERARVVRDEFLGLMSHELKTPIAVISGNAEVLAKRGGQLDHDERDAALADIRGEAERLHRVVDNLLVLARLERGQQIGRNPIDIERVIRQRVDQHRIEWPEREFILDITAGVPPIDASPAYVSQTMRNLLTNAEQHSPPRAAIEVRVRHQAEQAIVSVMDRGDGVPEHEVDVLFEPVTRLAGGGVRTRGAGIGLAASKRLVEAQRGRIWAQRREGGGMVFSFTLPVA